MALAAAVGRAAAEHARKMAELRQVKPQPLAKLYGANGPTPEQAAAHAEQLKAWAKRYRLASRLHKLALAPAMREALKGLRHGGIGGCFCEHSIGNPMYPDHTHACQQARAALKLWEAK